jgi:hypothetical protein
MSPILAFAFWPSKIFPLFFLHLSRFFQDFPNHSRTNCTSKFWCGVVERRQAIHSGTIRADFKVTVNVGSERNRTVAELRVRQVGQLEAAFRKPACF